MPGQHKDTCHVDLFCVEVDSVRLYNARVEFRMGKFNKRGSCKLQLPQVKFKMFEFSPLSNLRDDV